MLVDKRWAQGRAAGAEAVFEDLDLLIQLAASLLGHGKLCGQAVMADPVAWTRTVFRTWTAGGVVDERSEIPVALQEVAVHTCPGDHDPPADPAVFPAQLVERFQYGRALPCRILSASVRQTRYALLVALGSVIDHGAKRINNVAALDIRA